jgi:hypothetical protein
MTMPDDFNPNLPEPPEEVDEPDYDADLDSASLLATQPDLDPEPTRDENYYEWVQWWHRQPQNKDKAIELDQVYIAAMLRDPHLD